MGEISKLVANRGIATELWGTDYSGATVCVCACTLPLRQQGEGVIHDRCLNQKTESHLEDSQTSGQSFRVGGRLVAVRSSFKGDPGCRDHRGLLR